MATTGHPRRRHSRSNKDQPDFWGDFDAFLFEAYGHPDPFGLTHSTSTCRSDQTLRGRLESGTNGGACGGESKMAPSPSCTVPETGNTINESPQRPSADVPGSPAHQAGNNSTDSDSAREPRSWGAAAVTTNKKAGNISPARLGPPPASASLLQPPLSHPAAAARQSDHRSRRSPSLSPPRMEQPTTARGYFQDPWADRLEKSVAELAYSSPMNGPLSPPPSSRLGTWDDFDSSNGASFRKHSVPRSIGFSSTPPLNHAHHPSQYQLTPAGSPSFDSDPFAEKADQMGTSPQYTTAMPAHSMSTMTSPTTFDSPFWDHNPPPVGLSFDYGANASSMNDSKVQPWWPIDSAGAPNSTLDPHARHAGQMQRTGAAYRNQDALTSNSMANGGLMLTCPSPSSSHLGRSLSMSAQSQRSSQQHFVGYGGMTNGPAGMTGPSSMHNNRPGPYRHNSTPYATYRTPSPPSATRTPTTPKSSAAALANRRSISKHYGTTGHRRSKTISSATAPNGGNTSSNGRSAGPGGNGGGAGGASGFVNFTPDDSHKILTGVAPSGSSKTKARREKEAAERRRKTFQAAARVILANGGDVKDLEREGLFV